MTVIVISSGHSTKCRGASGYLDEVNEATRVVNKVGELLRAAGVNVTTFHDTISTTQNENLNRIVNFHNSKTRDLDVSVHFNAYQTTSKPMGAECLYVTQQTLAAKVSAAMCEAHHLPNRGAKYRGDLFFLNNTEEPAILLEVCFVDSSADADAYRANFDAVCRNIAESIGNVQIDEAPPEQPVEPPEPGEPPELTEENRVDIQADVDGDDVSIWINDVLVHGEKNDCNVVDVSISAVGDVVVTINGEEFHNL